MGAATKLQANITNNLFEATQHWPALYVASRENSAYQHALIAYNDFSWSDSPYHDVITLAQVSAGYFVYILVRKVMKKIYLVGIEFAVEIQKGSSRNRRQFPYSETALDAMDFPPQLTVDRTEQGNHCE